MRIPALRGISASLHVIACIEDPTVIKKILAHLEKKAAAAGTGLLPEAQAPPPVCVQRTGWQAGLFE